MTARALAGALGAVAGLILCASAQAQNSYSFIDAAKSAVNYSLANATPQMKCADLGRLSTTDVTIISAQQIPAANGVPEHCRVTGNILPEIAFEVNLPASWNWRFYMNGNGGYAGERPDVPNRIALRGNALRNGFAAATTNTGHDATREPLGTFTVDRAKLIDYAFRAVHLTAVNAKRIAARYYGRPPAYSYWDGCSTGGRQGLMEAQRFPGDFDGIVAGAPVLNFIDTMVNGLWLSNAFFEVAKTLNPTPKTVALVGADAEFSNNVLVGARENAKRFGLQIVYDRSYPPSTVDYTPVARAVQAANPDVVLLASYPPDSVGMVRAATEVGLKAQLFGGAMVGMQFASLMTQLSEKLNRVVNYHFFVPSPKMNFPGIEAFLAKYQSRAKDAGIDPLGFYQPPFAYAAMQVLEQAVKATGGLDDEKLAAYIHANAFSTIVGEIKFDELGEWANARIIEVQFQNVAGSGLDQYMTGHKQVIVYPPEYADGKLDQPFAK